MNRIGLSQRALNDLMSLNLVFLGLIRARAAGRGPAASPFGLPRPLPAAIARLGNAELVSVAGCPFALCSFGLHEFDDWAGLLAQQVSEPAAADGWPGAAGRGRQFAAVALAMIRDLAVTEPHAASLFFGMPPALAELFAATDLAALPRFASEAEGSLKARLADHPRFWPELVAAARSASVDRQRAIRDLGLQLTLQRALGVNGGKPRGGTLCRSF
jgi:hypothetical protein